LRLNWRLQSQKILLLGICVYAAACATQAPPPPPPPAAPPPPPPVAEAPKPKPAPSKIVKASYQGTATAGQPTASGEPYNPNAMTAASKTLPLGSVVKVTNPENGRTVKVRINDRGPFVPGRSLDLSKKAAEKLGVTKKGVVKVKVTPVEKHPHVEEAKAKAPSTVKDATRTDITPVAEHPATDGTKSPAVGKAATAASITPITDHAATDGAKTSPAPQNPATGNAPAAPSRNPSVSEN